MGLLIQSTHHSKFAIFVYPNGFVYKEVCLSCRFYTYTIYSQNDIIFPVKYNIYNIIQAVELFCINFVFNLINCYI